MYPFPTLCRWWVRHKNEVDRTEIPRLNNTEMASVIVYTARRFACPA